MWLLEASVSKEIHLFFVGRAKTGAERRAVFNIVKASTESLPNCTGILERFPEPSGRSFKCLYSGLEILRNPL